MNLLRGVSWMKRVENMADDVVSMHMDESPAFAIVSGKRKATESLRITFEAGQGRGRNLF